MSAILSLDISTFAIYVNATQRTGLLCSLSLVLGTQQKHTDSCNFVFSTFGIPYPVLRTRYYRIILPQKTWPITEPHALITDKKMKLKPRRENRTVQSDSASQWQSWDQNYGVHSQSAIHCPSIYWALLCSGHYNTHSRDLAMITTKKIFFL